MKLQTLFCDKMASNISSHSVLVSWISILSVILLTLAGFSGFGLLSVFLTYIALLSSTLLFTRLKQKTEQPEKKTSTLSQVHECLGPKYEIGPQRKEEEEERIARSSGDSSLSESECINPSTTSEDSEVEWPFRESGEDHSLDCSDDGTISDEESLIEIAIPTGHYVGHKDGEHRLYNMQQIKKIPDFSPDSIFHGNSCLMDLLAEINEMNEEDNLIEIDISMGSIKCSRYEIQARN